MDKIFEVVNSFWFKSAVAGAIGCGLLIYGHELWAGFAFGIAVDEFLDFFKKK